MWVGQRAYDRWRTTRDAGPPSTDEHNASFGMLVVLSIVGTLLHVAMDLPTQSGTRLLSPFDWRWFSIDLMPIVDVYLLAALVAGLLFGRQSPAARQRNAAIVLVLMTANYGLRAVEHSQALAAVPRLFGPTLAPPCDPQSHDGWRPIDVWPRQRATTSSTGKRCLVELAAMPTFTSPFRWQIIAQVSNAYELRDVRPGHKIARRARGTGEAVRRYGQVIGFATQPIGRGEHVHTHNLAVGDYQREYEVGVDVRPVDYYPPDQMRYFDGFKRADGRVGTRNYLAVISTVNCSASVCQFIRERFRDVQRDFPNVDGVIAITHKSGCGTKLFGEDHEALMRVLGGYAAPSERGRLRPHRARLRGEPDGPLHRAPAARRGPASLSIQEAGGVRKTVEAGIKAVAGPPAGRERGAADAAAALGADPRDELRRLRRRLRDHREPGAGLGGGRAGRATAAPASSRRLRRSTAPSTS